MKLDIRVEANCLTHYNICSFILRFIISKWSAFVLSIFPSLLRCNIEVVTTLICLIIGNSIPIPLNHALPRSATGRPQPTGNSHVEFGLLIIGRAICHIRPMIPCLECHHYFIRRGIDDRGISITRLVSSNQVDVEGYNIVSVECHDPACVVVKLVATA